VILIKKNIDWKLILLIISVIANIIFVYSDIQTYNLQKPDIFVDIGTTKNLATVYDENNYNWDFFIYLENNKQYPVTIKNVGFIVEEPTDWKLGNWEQKNTTTIYFYDNPTNNIILTTVNVGESYIVKFSFGDIVALRILTKINKAFVEDTHGNKYYSDKEVESIFRGDGYILLGNTWNNLEINYRVF